MIGIKVKTDNKYAYVTMNYRHIVENGWLDDLEYICEPTENHVKRYTFKVITSIGVTREFNRHRKNSILEMSTRYCNFSKDKFDNQVSFCKPSWLDLNLGTYEIVGNNKDLGDVVGDGYIKNVSNRDEDNLFLTSCLFAEDTYKELLGDGWKPQQAREILPLCTATEAVYTGFAEDWKHFFNLRFFETTGKVHPNMMELSTKMKEECEKANIWNNIIKDNNEN
jgi:thymidylate synthase (FAD)